MCGISEGGGMERGADIRTSKLVCIASMYQIIDVLVVFDSMDFIE